MRLVAKLLGLALFGGVAVLGAPSAQAFLMTQPYLNNETLCVDVKGSSTAPGTVVWAYPCNGSIAEQWNFVGPALQGLAPGLCLASKGGAAVLNACTKSGKGQSWGYDDYWIYQLGTDSCLDAEAGPFQQLAIHPCSTTAASQRWTLH
jgi:hypothetical protein